jgi:5-formyltetrahydrofolate cyclo-ligase
MTAQAGDTLDSFSAHERKRALRAELRRLRQRLPRAERRRAARRATARLLAWAPLKRARHVGVYLDSASELSTAALVAALQRAGRRLWVPVASTDGGLRFAPLRKGARLTRGIFGVLRPVRARPLRHARALDVIVLPLLAFDARGTRLGQGGGHYDRALAAVRDARRPLRVGYAYAAQERPLLPAAEHDCRLHAVATERGLRWLR